ncbi:MAG: SRPBCC family protein [Aureispira sp.]
MKSISKEINSSITIQATKEDVFKVISNHVGTPTWVMEVEEVKLLKEGTPKNGVGAIREVNFRPKLWATVQEEIVAYEENKGFQYKVLQMPGLIDHLGIFEVVETSNNETTVSWKVSMTFKKFHFFSLFVNKFAKDFKKVQVNGLEYLKKELEGKE